MRKSEKHIKFNNRLLLMLLFSLLAAALIAIGCALIFARNILIERDRLSAKFHVLQIVLDSTYEGLDKDAYKEKWFDGSLSDKMALESFINSLTYPINQISRIEACPHFGGSGWDAIQVQFANDKVFILVVSHYGESIFGLPTHTKVTFISEETFGDIHNDDID